MVKPRDAQKTVKFIDEYCEVYRTYLVSLLQRLADKNYRHFA